MTSPIRREDKGPVAWLTLDRPAHKNALNRELVGGLETFVADLECNDDIRVVVVTGTGDAFCAGADLREVLGPDGKIDPPRLLAFERWASAVFERLAALPKPVIAAVNGTALAGGLELVLHCDLAVAAEHARLGDGHLTYGLLPGAGGAARLARVIGPTRAKYLAFTAALLPAAECRHMGLVNEVVPGDQLAERAAELAGELAERSPSALRLFKQVIDDGLEQPLTTALRLEHLATAEHLHSGDVDEGLAAFAAKRKPDFSKGARR